MRASICIHRTPHTSGASLRSRIAGRKPKWQHFCCLQRSQCYITSCSACRLCREHNNTWATQDYPPSYSASPQPSTTSAESRARSGSGGSGVRMQCCVGRMEPHPSYPPCADARQARMPANADARSVRMLAMTGSAESGREPKNTPAYGRGSRASERL